MIHEGANGFKNRYVPETAVNDVTSIFSATDRVDDTDDVEALGPPHQPMSCLGIGGGKPSVGQDKCCVLHSVILRLIIRQQFNP